MYRETFRNELGADVLNRYQQMIGYFSEFERAVLKEWKITAYKQIAAGMAKPVLLVENKKLTVNFDDEVNIT